MSLASENGQYGSAGAVFADDVKFHISESAYLPDGDAGTEFAGSFRTDHRREKKKKTFLVPTRVAVFLLSAVLFVCGISVLLNVYRINTIEKQIADMRTQMDVTRQETDRLREDVAQNRDLARIGYIAVHELGMVASNDGNTVRMYIPQIEWFSGTVEAPGDADGQEGTVGSAGRAAASY